MKRSTDQSEPQTQEIVDPDYVGISAFLLFLVILWQHTYFDNVC